MFAAGSIVGNLSDKFGRKNMLLVTTTINILGYFATYLALKLGSTVMAGNDGIRRLIPSISRKAVVRMSGSCDLSFMIRVIVKMYFFPFHL
jgi:MFS family permease